MEIINCPECGKENPSEAVQCDGCGFPFSELVDCPDCGHKNPKESKVCRNCGCPLRAETEKSESVRKIPIQAVLSVLAVILIVAITAIGVSKSKADFKDKLVEGSVWLEVETNSRVRFDEDGKMLYMIFGFHGLKGGLEYSLATCEYEVKTGNKIKVGGETVKVDFRSDGKIMFDPDIAPLVDKAVKEAEKGE